MLSSRSLLLAAALASVLAHDLAPPPVDEEASIGPVGGLQQDLLLFSPVEFLQKYPPSLVLEGTFPTPDHHALFEQWKNEFDRAYDTLRDHALRKLVWLENHARIDEHNSRSPPAGHSLAHNDFSDLTHEEFRKRFYLGEHSPGVKEGKGMSDGSSWLTSPSRKLRRADEDGVEFFEEGGTSEADEATVADVPEYKNWKEEGAVTKVKNQWFCGACWAFSAIGAIEGARYIKTSNLTELSIQQLIDCDMTDMGCSGGLMHQAFAYDDSSAVGLCSLEQYPFAYHRHWFYGCRRYMPYCTPLSHTKVAKYVNVTKTEDDLKAAVATQPVSVAVAAGTHSFDWQFYSGGTFHQDCDGDIDHGVLAVGYGHYDPSKDPKAKIGSDEAGDYWLIKNSWGERWGLDGFMRMSRNTGNEAGGGSSCILTLASRPIMKAED